MSILNNEFVLRYANVMLTFFWAIMVQLQSEYDWEINMNVLYPFHAKYYHSNQKLAPLLI